MMSTRPYALQITMPDFMAAVDLQTRVEATAHTQVVPTAEGASVVLTVSQSGLRNILRSLAAWLQDSNLGELELRVNQRPFIVQRETSGGLKWRDAEGAELDDIQIEKATQVS